jgi:hypothetical protein
MSVMVASCLPLCRSKQVPHVSVVMSASKFKGKLYLPAANRAFYQAVFQGLKSSRRAYSVKLRHKGVSQGF